MRNDDHRRFLLSATPYETNKQKKEKHDEKKAIKIKTIKTR